MIERREVTIPLEGAFLLSGWLFIPEGNGSFPAITMAHGYGGTIYHGLEPFGRAFAEAGFVVLLHDHRGFGRSDGQPRQDINPWQQIADWRRAISFLEAQPNVDASRIGLWGTSYAGGHAIVLGATDRRLRAIIAQVPTVSGYEQGLRRIRADRLSAVEDALSEDERAQLRGEAPQYAVLVDADPAVGAAYHTQDAIDFTLQPLPEGVWENKVTLRSSRHARMYEPGIWITRVSPTPLLLVVARDDKTTPTDLALAAYERALEPKRLVIIPGGHYDPYVAARDAAVAAAISWFSIHL